MFEIVLEYLREWVVKNAKDELERRWPNDLRLQAYRDWHVWYKDFLKAHMREEDFTLGILLVLRKLNLLNKFAHTCASRVLGHSVVVHVPSSPWLLNVLSRDIGSLGDDYTRVLDFCCDTGYPRHSSGEILSVRGHFLEVLQGQTRSLRILQFSFSDKKTRSVENTLKVLLDSAPYLEELCVFCRSGATVGMVKVLFGEEFAATDSASLRIIRLSHFAFEEPSNLDQGLPSELSSLRKFRSLEEVHVYNVTPERSDSLRSIQKLTWTRTAENEFGLESAWFSARPYQGHIRNGISTSTSQLVTSARNVTLEIPFYSAHGAAPSFLSIWPSLDSLTILTDDFPSSELLEHVPSAVDSVIIRFEAYYCEVQPMVADQRMFDFLQRSATKNTRFCINMMENRETTPTETVVSWLEAPDEKLFVRTRALCFERGGKFTSVVSN